MVRCSWDEYHSVVYVQKKAILIIIIIIIIINLLSLHKETQLL